MTISIGIDPGQTGAIAAIREGLVLLATPMPIYPRLHGGGMQVDANSLASTLLGLKSDGDHIIVSLEAVSARSGQGVSSMFRFGESLGVVIGVCGTLHLPIHWVTPQKWKKAAGISLKEKDASITLAKQRHPEAGDFWTKNKKTNSGIADAICIAEFAPLS